MTTAEDTAEHQFLREEMCDQQLLGGDGACRYYLSILTNIDHFALWSDEFVANAGIGRFLQVLYPSAA
jgi:hypothetical protein